MATIRTRKFMSNRLLGRKQFVSGAADLLCEGAGGLHDAALIAPRRP
jgi:hypothetical protein